MRALRVEIGPDDQPVPAGCRYEYERRARGELARQGIVLRVGDLIVFGRPAMIAVAMEDAGLKQTAAYQAVRTASNEPWFVFVDDTWCAPLSRLLHWFREGRKEYAKEDARLGGDEGRFRRYGMPDEWWDDDGARP